MGVNTICMTSNGLDMRMMGSFLVCKCTTGQFGVHLTPHWDSPFYHRDPNFENIVKLSGPKYDMYGIEWTRYK